MTHDEIIAVVAAHRDGKKIEVRSAGSNGAWFIEDNPRFNFGCIEHRIAEPRWRDATIDDLHKCPLKCRVPNFTEHNWRDNELTGYSLNGLHFWQTKDFKWHRQCQVLEDE